MADPLGTFNPLIYTLAADSRIYTLVFDYLLLLNPEGKIVPDLAQSYTVSDDHKTWTFKLRSGGKFHDGQPVTAKDAAFTLNLYKKREDSTGHFFAAPIDKAEALDDVTLVVHMVTPIPNLDLVVTLIPILPAHLWQPLDDGSKKVIEFTNDALIGSGPYKLAEYKKGDFIRLTAVKGHWAAPAHFDELVIQIISDTKVLDQALIDGKIDAIYYEQDAAAVAQLQKAQNVKVLIGPPESPTVQLVALNQLDPKQCPKDGTCNGHPALRDLKVRQAIMFAIDKAKLAAASGLGTTGAQLIPAAMGAWSNTSLKGYDLDVAKANQMLDEAGYKDTNGDGVREMPDGSHPLIFRHVHETGSARIKAINDVLTEALKAIGIKVEAQTLDFPTLFGTNLAKFDFDLISFSWIVPDPALFLVLGQSAQIGVFDAAGYSNSEYDALYQKQGVEFDVAKRQGMMQQMQALLDRDAVYIVVNYPQVATAARSDRFVGWQTDSTQWVLPLLPEVLAKVAPVK